MAKERKVGVWRTERGDTRGVTLEPDVTYLDYYTHKGIRKDELALWQIASGATVAVSRATWRRLAGKKGE
jgi:hypothetical protein